MATPSIPPRPSRTENNTSVMASHRDMPPIPARPKRNVTRSVSPNRDSFARSPLNDPAYATTANGPTANGRGAYKPPEAPPRPPSVTLPSIGQEGSEYEHATPAADEPGNPIETKTSNVSSDMPLHAPKASLPVSLAKQRVAAVTRTDSSQAAAHGIGKAISESEAGQSLTRSSSRQSQTRSRPASLYKMDAFEQQEDTGIPMIGLQVPMYPNAGDVQAPTPSASAQHAPAKGVGFFNNVGTASPRHHSRTKSGRDVFIGPPGSYGLHGHGVNKLDPLEKAWYERHPEALAREAKGEYGPAISEDRKEYALSTEELNKLVHTKSYDGIQTAPVSTPNEDIGYLASEEYAQRLISRPGSTKPRRPSSQTYTESPLRKMSFPQGELDDALRAAKSHDHALESEAEDDVIHVIPVPRTQSRFSNSTPQPPLDRNAIPDLDRQRTPILAADEAAYRPDAQYLTPAVEPEYERRNSTYLDLDGGSRSQSRSNSMNANSLHQLSQFHDHRHENVGTPLEDVKEYEPLFPDEDEVRAQSAPVAAGAGDKAKAKLARPDHLARHHFPSQDVWEDTPDSLQYVTTVDSPQLPDESHPSAEHEPQGVYENSEKEESRKENLPAPSVTDNMLKPKFKSEVLSEQHARPGLGQRFPSQDIWEDTPSSHLYTTTVGPDDEEAPSPVAAKQPSIPARPAGRTQGSPMVPDRPKPQVPNRPSKLRSSDEAPLVKTLSKESSDGSASEVLTTNAKPPVPARPAASKIAALQAGFMSDLNKKLGLGPQAPKKDEPKEEGTVEEKVPLADARKGRARGPQRRKPGASPSDAGEETKDAPAAMKPIFKFTISLPQTIWEVDEGVLNVVPVAPVVEAKAPAVEKPAVKDIAQSAIEPVSGADQTQIKTSSGSAVQNADVKLEVANHGTDETEKTTADVGGKTSQEGAAVGTEDSEEHSDPVSSL